MQVNFCIDYLLEKLHCLHFFHAAQCTGRGRAGAECGGE